MINPLIEKPVIGPTGQFLDYRAEVFCNYVAQSMPFEICFDALAEHLFAKFGSKHVQHPAAFAVGSVVKLLPATFVLAIDDWFMLGSISK